jgi:hypothetical protein
MMEDQAPIVSQTAFHWFLIILTGGFAGTWFVYDALKLFWLRTASGKDPVVHDKRFGYACGVVIGFIGVWGCLRFHGVV